MTAADTITIRPAREHDDWAIRRLAGLDSQRPLSGDVLLAEVDGRPVAAISATAGRVTADPFLPTAMIVAMLRAHAQTATSEPVAAPERPKARLLVPA